MDALLTLLSPALLIPVLGILMPVGIVALALNFAHKARERRHQTIVSLLERGLPVPPELLRGTAGGSPRSSSPLMRALTLIGAGLGLSGFLFAMEGLHEGIWAAGLVPLCVGLAQLVAIRLEPAPPGAGNADR